MTVRPLHDRIIVQRIDEGEQNVGGIIIPDSAKEKPQQGTVIAAGNGRAKDNRKRIPLEVENEAVQTVLEVLARRRAAAHKTVHTERLSAATKPR
jgi:co-chaperonin GroES (HSP10)